MTQEEQMTPKEIVSQLDNYIVGQDEAKKSVSIALRNRYRRLQLDPQMQEDITPKNLLMIGPTGVGKTEIARRLAKIVDAPFVKVEATKFTEVGYVGGDVNSMVRDLVENSVQMEKKIQFKNVRREAEKKANQDLAEIISREENHVDDAQEKSNNDKKLQDTVKELNKAFKKGKPMDLSWLNEKDPFMDQNEKDKIKDDSSRILTQIENGELEDREVKISIDDPSAALNADNSKMEQMGINLQGLENMLPKKQVERVLPLKEAREALINQESETLIDDAKVNGAAIKRAENTGIIFIDEIDKLTGGNKQTRGEVSREGVQRDILPIVEGVNVNTKYGVINTNHILFIGSGAFADSKPSDLIPELQGRFPIRVELNDLSKDDFVKILTEPSDALIKQYVALIGTDNIKVTFTKEAIEKIADIAYSVNHDTDNIGARRLHTILEKLLEDILYEGPDMHMGDITINQKYVEDKVGNLAADENVARYIL